MARALRAWAINRGGKNSVRNLRYGPRTRLIRGIYFQVSFSLKAILNVAKITSNINKTLNINIHGKLLTGGKGALRSLEYFQRGFQTNLDINIDYNVGFDPYKNCLQVELVSRWTSVS